MELKTISEEELSSQAVYTVQDSPCPLNTPNRAEKSLPKNLVLKPTNALPDSSIIGKSCPLNTPNRAEKSLPKNLVLKPTNALPDSSIIG
jgi:hypothetical protein